MTRDSWLRSQQHNRSRDQEETGLQPAEGRRHSRRLPYAGQTWEPNSTIGTDSRSGRPPNPGASVAAGDDRIGGFVRSLVAESTWASYGKVWKEWEQLGNWVGGTHSPQDRQEPMFWWVYWMAEQGRTVVQIEKGMGALVFLFKLRGWEDLNKGFVVRQVIKGFKRSRVRQDSRSLLLDDTLYGLVFQAAPGGIQRNDVELSEERVDKWLSRSKTDKGRRVVLYAIRIGAISPYVNVQQFLMIQPNIEGPLFIHEDGTSFTRFQAA
ncbi:uncharacterized protein LOC121393217 [Xenopus laevis]|uniref:Uncharacterized protein LOC121393217 n=1 Tax=Xenopus laevis TaxID=8355 RepID=A0A8J1KI97_XENLA|nr:uncharacterized protein LOC121393217 [Xenopus laevis]